MGRNLGPLNIKDSYEGLVQISGSQLTDGSGSLIPSLAVSASFATTANTATSASHALNADNAISSSYAVTASFALNAGASTLQEVLDNSNTATGVDIILTGSYQRASGSFSGNVIDNITDTYTGTDKINHVVTLTQAEYNALTPSSDTFYVITDAAATMITGSVTDATLTFTKDDATTFPLAIAATAYVKGVLDHALREGLPITYATEDNTWQFQPGKRIILPNYATRVALDEQAMKYGMEKKGDPRLRDFHAEVLAFAQQGLKHEAHYLDPFQQIYNTGENPSTKLMKELRNETYINGSASHVDAARANRCLRRDYLDSLPVQREIQQCVA